MPLTPHLTPSQRMRAKRAALPSNTSPALLAHIDALLAQLEAGSMAAYRKLLELMP